MKIWNKPIFQSYQRSNVIKISQIEVESNLVGLSDEMKTSKPSSKQRVKELNLSFCRDYKI
jgi:hypothetical protein